MFDFIYVWFFGLIWSGLMNFVQLIWDLIIWLSGGTPSLWFCENILKTSQAAAGNNNILKSLLLGDQIMSLFGIMVAVAGTLIVVTIIVSVIRSEVSAEDNVKSKKKLILSSCKAVLFTLLLPAIFFFAVYLFNTMSNLLVASMGSNNSSLINLLIMIGGGDAVDTDAIASLDWATLSTMSSNEMNKVFADLSLSSITLTSFNWLLVLLISLVCIIVLAMAVLPLIERLIVLALLVVAAPIVCAIYPLDDGNRFGIWKDLFISKMISALGIILCMQIYIILCSILNELIPGGFLGSICKIVIMILGLFVFNKGAHVLANLVGHSTGMMEGQSQMSTMHAIGAIIHGGSMIANAGKGLKSLAGGAVKEKAGDAMKTVGGAMGESKGGAQAMSGIMKSMTHPTTSLATAQPGGGAMGGLNAIGSGGGQGSLPSSNNSMQNTNSLAQGATEGGQGKIAENKQGISTPSSGLPIENKNAMNEVAATSMPKDAAMPESKAIASGSQQIQTAPSGLGAISTTPDAKEMPTMNQTNIAQGNALEPSVAESKKMSTITTGTSGIANMVNSKPENKDNDVADGGTKK